MTFEEVKICIRDFKIQNLKIVDTNSKKIMEFIQELSPENLIGKLESFMPTLQSYGRVNFIAANETQFKQNWKDCYSWPVVFTGATNHLTTIDQPNRSIGFVSQNEATLMAQVQVMQMQMNFAKEMSELKAQLSAPKEHQYERLADKYLPLVMAISGMKLEPEQIQQMMGWYQIQNQMNGKNPMVQQNTNTGIAGIKQEPTIQQTKEEAEVEKNIVDEMNALSTKISDEKILILVKALNANPAAADTLIGMINPPKT